MRTTAFVVGLLIACALLVMPPVAKADDARNGIYVDVRYADGTHADTSTVYCKRVDNGYTVTDVTGDDYPSLERHVARFSTAPPPGTGISGGYSYVVKARKTRGALYCESSWSGSISYNGAEEKSVTLYLGDWMGDK